MYPHTPSSTPSTSEPKPNNRTVYSVKSGLWSTHLSAQRVKRLKAPLARHVLEGLLPIVVQVRVCCRRRQSFQSAEPAAAARRLDGSPHRLRVLGLVGWWVMDQARPARFIREIDRPAPAPSGRICRGCVRPHPQTRVLYVPAWPPCDVAGLWRGRSIRSPRGAAPECSPDLATGTLARGSSVGYRLRSQRLFVTRAESRVSHPRA